MKRSIVALVRVTALAVPLAFGAAVVEPIAGPGLGAQTATCRYKIVFAPDGSMYCTSEPGWDCFRTCAGET